jgi:hypothetical protein
MTHEEIDADLNTLRPAVRLAYQEVGSRYSSDDTKAQGESTLEAHTRFGALVGPRGFSAAQVARLTWALAAITFAQVDREGRRIDSKTTVAGLKAGLKTGKAHRFALRALLAPVPNLLRAKGTEPADQAASQVETVLGRTSSAGSNPNRLADQIELLATELGKDAVQAAAGADLVAPALTEAATAVTTLRALAAQRPGRPGTPKETERLDVLDGIIIELVRQARAAARVASRMTGNPAIEQEYALDHLG